MYVYIRTKIIQITVEVLNQLHESNAGAIQVQVIKCFKVKSIYIFLFH